MGWYNLPPVRFDAHNGICNAKNGCCPNCGAQVNSAKLLCEYCGTHFSESMVPIVMERPEVKILQTNQRIDMEAIVCYGDDPSFAEYIKMEIAKKMAIELLPYMDFIEEDDMIHRQKVIRARMRVVDKEFHF